MKKMFLTLVMAAMAASVSFGACDEVCWNECAHIKDKQQQKECFVGCGYDETGGVCIKEIGQPGKIRVDKSGTEVFTHDNGSAAR